MIRILFLGDVVGEPGRHALNKRLKGLQEELAADFTIVNGENAAGGRGISGKQCIELLRAGATVISLAAGSWQMRPQPYSANVALTRPKRFVHASSRSSTTTLSQSASIAVTVGADTADTQLARSLENWG